MTTNSGGSFRDPLVCKKCTLISDRFTSTSTMSTLVLVSVYSIVYNIILKSKSLQQCAFLSLNFKLQVLSLLLWYWSVQL